MDNVRPKLVNKTFRIDPRLWAEAESLAASNEKLMPEVLRELLATYVTKARAASKVTR